MDTAKKKILVAEDDEFLSSLIHNRLEKEKFDVKTARDGDETLALMKSFMPDLVLLDIILPGKLGFEILQEMKADPAIKNIPFMIISNLGQDSDMDKAKELGAIEYFVKAKIVIDDLIKKISSFFNSPAK